MLTTIRMKIKEDGEYKFGRWGSFWHRFSVSYWRWGVSLCKFDECWSLHLFCLWVELWQTRIAPEGIMESWGAAFYPDEQAFHFNWGSRCKIIHMPWSYDHCRTEVMLNSGAFVPYEKWFIPKAKREAMRAKGIFKNPEPANLYCETFLYRYFLRRGEIQSVQATVTVERRSWCWRSIPFRWLRWPSKVRTSIHVEFSSEVGEKAGSWKGGCVGCGYDLLPGESPEACLRRMESERKF